MKITTTDLTPGDKVNHNGIVRVVDGIRADPSWKIGDPGHQPVQVMFAPAPAASLGWARASVDPDHEWETSDGAPGDLAQYETVYGVDRSKDMYADYADNRAEYEYLQRIGER